MIELSFKTDYERQSKISDRRSRSSERPRIIYHEKIRYVNKSVMLEVFSAPKKLRYRSDDCTCICSNFCHLFDIAFPIFSPYNFSYLAYSFPILFITHITLFPNITIFSSYSLICRYFHHFSRIFSLFFSFFTHFPPFYSNFAVF